MNTLKRMKKETSLTAEDGSQQKISSFFQKPSSTKPESKLFTNVGKSRPSLTLQRQASVKKHNADASKSTSASEKGHANAVDRDKKMGLREVVNLVPKENVTSQLGSAPLPLHTTPEKPGPASGLDVTSPDIMLIPDTPEDKVERQRPKAVRRSFLTSASSLTTMPGKKPSLLKAPKTKRVLKKTSGLVSVEFGKQTISERNACVQNVSSDAEIKQMVDLTEDCMECTVSMSETVLFSEANDYKDNCGASHFSDKTFPSEKNLDCEVQKATDSATPTKLYSDGKSVKRMSKSGLSPDAKRTSHVSDTEMSTSMHPDLSVPSRAIKAKRQLVAMSAFKDIKELNRSVNTYQLGGAPRDRLPETEASCEDDAVLADILGQMVNTTGPQKQFVNQSQEKPVTTIPDTQVADICENEEEGRTAMESDNLLDDILDELQNPANLTNTNKRQKLGNSADRNHKPFSFTREEREDVVPTRIKPKTPVPAPFLVAEQKKVCKVPDLRQFDQVTTSSGGKERTVNHLSGRNNDGAFRQTSDLDTQDHHVSADVEDALAGSFSEMSPFKNACMEKKTTKNATFTDQWNRFTVQYVSYDRNSHEVHLELRRDGESGDSKRCILQGFWADTHVQEGDVVHVLSDSNQSGPNTTQNGVLVVSDTQGQIVVNPDLLLSGTVIVSGVYCLRRSVLNEKFKGIDGKNVHMLYGSIIHSLFQEAVKEKLCQRDEILATARSVVQSSKFLHDMYGQGVTEQKVMEEVENYIEPLQAWQHKYMDNGNRGTSNRPPSSELSVVKIHDIEETIWSPRIGVKGKIDMTVEVKLQNDRGKITQKVLPLELKTGKASYSAEHKGQVTLYSMMTSDRRDDPGEGLLLYLKHSDMKVIPVKQENKQGLLQLRNEMAYYLNRQTVKVTGDDGHVDYHLGRLPQPINSQRSCSKCPHLTNCAIYQKAVEGLEHSEGHAMKQLVPEALSHLSPSHLTYFTHWLLCMDLEMASERSKGLRNIWCMPSDERERQGDCLQQMVIVDTVLGVPETQAFTEGQGCCVLFQRKPGSEDGRLIGLSTGFIKDVSDSVVEVVVDRDSFHENAAFQPLVFRIDRCDSFNTAGYLLSNLSRLVDSTPHCSKLRSLIIDGRKPEFNLTMSKTAVEKVKTIFKRLNKPQKTAILKVLMCKDFVLIKGYPGTGKTSTIVALVKILKELGQSVLLTSYTHSAVDNILLKLKKDGVPFLRLGRSSRIHPQIQDHAAETLTLDIKSVAELRDFYSSYAIVATSCLGINHPVFTQRKFDVCIVDEASQVLQPACLGPLFHADRFILVGDPQQLPPVVQSKEASGLGMEESLFVRLDGAGATYDLNLQYRMNSSIMQLSNELVYQGALKCGSPAVAEACIQPQSIDLAEQCEWLHRALDPSLANSVLFLDTSKISAHEASDGKGLWNEMEANLILSLCNTFVQAGISCADIGVIAPYRSQVKYLQHLLADTSLLHTVEVNTVDQYQGRDKSVILISFVCSSSAGAAVKKGGLLQDVRRLNVAVTRAKHKLVLVGNSQTLTHYQPVRTLLQNMENRQQVSLNPTLNSVVCIVFSVMESVYLNHI
ncbi:hypothetical protein BaRGS_00020815 [Batillaria attramentaria]|uniref:DNA replication ATP-dependent helicase/nuclease n=1 Tax=Batillaria attramentaria TaxID=370345 RepID=A0ABD0KLC7_9CAEN